MTVLYQDVEGMIMPRQPHFEKLPTTDRPPKRIEELRRCWCGQKLSVYNPGKTCRRHAPIRFPRVRGRDLLSLPGDEPAHDDEGHGDD